MTSSNQSLDYILALLARLDLLIRREVLKWRQQQPQLADDEFRGLYISHEEIDALLVQPDPSARLLTGAPGPSDLLSALDSALQAADARVAAIEADAHARGETLRLARLSEL